MDWSFTTRRTEVVAVETVARDAPTEEEIDAVRTAKGGWTRDTLAGWGVPWPPPRGWRKALIEASSGGTENEKWVS